MSEAALEFVEVSPRDGLQNEPELVSTENKIALIERAIAAGFRRIEVASFVNPKKVPQMADGEAVMAGLPARDDVTHIALALNQRGYDRAVAAGAKEVNFVLVATDEFAIRNSGTTVEGLLDIWQGVADSARRDGVRVSATISTAFGCPFEGEVAPQKVVDIARRAAAAEPFEIALADTIGVGVPGQVRTLVRETRAAVGEDIQLRVHFHNTRNTAVANALAAYEEGVRIIDGSLAGVGGCPFAPGAAGNVPTEDLVYMFERMGVSTGIDLNAAISAAHFIGDVLGKATPGMVSRAGGFPKPAAA